MALHYLAHESGFATTAAFFGGSIESAWRYTKVVF